MAETTNISWADATVNFWTGCTKVSPACDGCYAENLMDTRFGRAKWGGPGKGVGTRTRTAPSNWQGLPQKLERQAIKTGTRPFIFANSLSDTFDNAVPAEWRREMFDVIRATPHLVWLLLTKRPQNIIRMSLEAGGLPPNAALGTTCEDQKRVEANVPHLCEAKMHLWPLFTFVSLEPLLGEIDLRRIRINGAAFNFMLPHHDHFDALHPHAPWRIEYVIAGGESDQGAHKARPTYPGWFRLPRDQCEATRTPFHLKQNGEWLGGDQIPEDEVIPSGISNDCGIAGADDNQRVWRVGKARAGRMLDGVVHDARPEVRS